MQEYVHLSNRSDAALGHFGQIPPGRRNDFHLGLKHAWKGTQPSRRMVSSVMFVIPAPRQRDLWVRILLLEVALDRSLRRLAIGRQQPTQLGNIDLGLAIDALAVAEGAETLDPVIGSHA